MKSVIAIAAHPDDIEFLMAGTLMRLGQAGYQLHYMNVANGSVGTTKLAVETIVQIRREEAMSAAAQLGATFHDSLCDDISIFYDRPTLARVASVIRQVQPDIVLTHSLSDYMEDHTNTCRLAVTAAFSRGMPNFAVEPPCDPVLKPVTIYHAQPYSHYDSLRQLVHPEFFVDVTELIAAKTSLLELHHSQKQWLDESQGLDSYLATQRDLDRQCGEMSGRFEYAEGWRRHSHLGFCGPDDDPLRDALPTTVCN